MDRDPIDVIGIDNKGRLYVRPRSRSFPYIYREAMEVHWDIDGHFLFAPPPPRAQLASPAWWFKQILFAAREQGVELYIQPETTWQNISLQLFSEISTSCGSASA